MAIAIFFGSIFSNNFGLINAVLQSLHLPAVAWLSNRWTIKLVIAALMTWQWTGYNAIIYLAGLQAIPTEVYEAARIDGAGLAGSSSGHRPAAAARSSCSPWSSPPSPGCRASPSPRCCSAATAADQPQLRRPGPGRSDHVLYFYHQAFDNNDFGYGAAIVWALFLLILLFVLDQLALWCSARSDGRERHEPQVAVRRAERPCAS